MRVGIVGDTHEPFCHPMYLNFVQDVFADWGVEHTHFAGDLVDNHAISFHETDPDGLSGGDEMECAQSNTEKWHETFPDSTVSIGNHDALHYRRAKCEGIPEGFMRPYNEVWGTPSWDWDFHHEFDAVRYQHGTGSNGKDAAINQAISRRQSVVQGHTHTYAGAKFHANDTSIIFGLNVGCGIDCDAYAMAYAKDFPVRPVLGCGVVIDGHPYFEAMPCAPGDPYHKSKAKKTRRRKR